MITESIRFVFLLRLQLGRYLSDALSRWRSLSLIRRLLFFIPFLYLSVLCSVGVPTVADHLVCWLTMGC